MNIEQLTDFFTAGLVLHALELIEGEGNEGGTESEITERIEDMNEDELITGVAIGIRLINTNPDMFSEIKPQVDFVNPN